MILLLFVPNRTSKTHWSMNTGIAALVASSGKVKPKVSWRSLNQLISLCTETPPGYANAHTLLNSFCAAMKTTPDRVSVHTQISDFSVISV